MAEDEHLDEVREYVPRHETKKSIEFSAAQNQLQGTLNSNYILAKLSQNIDEFEKVINKQYDEFKTLGDEFWVRWYWILEKHNMQYLPPNMILRPGSKSLLHQELLSLIEEMMSRAGARKDQSKTSEVTISWISD